MPSVDLNLRFQLHDIIVDPLNNTLQFSNETVSAPHKLIALLKYFSEHPNRLITNDELSQNVWDGVLSEGTRYSQIANLRKLLRDDTNNPRFLKTIPRKGYIFIATPQPLSSISDSHIQKIPDFLNLTNKCKKRIKKWFAIAPICAVVVFSFFLYEKINLLQEHSVSDNTLSKVYSPLIGKEKNIFIIDSHIDPITNEDTWKIIRLTNAIIGYQLRQMQDNHIVFAPLSDKNFNHDLFIHHFKDIDKNPTTISLKFGRTDEHNQNIFRIGFTDQFENIETTVNTSTSVNETITTLEQKIIEKLEEFSDQLLTTNNISLEEINALHQLEFIKKSQTWNQVTHLRELNYLIEQATITKSDLIAYIAINHFIGYTYRWARDFEIDHIYEDIRPILNGQTTLSHNYLLAQLWIQAPFGFAHHHPVKNH